MQTEKKSKPETWVKLKPAEIEKTIIDLARQNMPSEKIGLILRDKHGIPKAKTFGKKIKQILVENNLYRDSEYENVDKKLDILKKHIEKNKHDFSAKKSLITHTARLNKLQKLRI